MFVTKIISLEICICLSTQGEQWTQMTHNLNQNLKIGGHLTFQPITFLSESPLFDAEILEAFEPLNSGGWVSLNCESDEPICALTAQSHQCQIDIVNVPLKVIHTKQ